MADIKGTPSASGSNIHVTVDVEAGVEGRSVRVLDDGTSIDGPKKQQFVRIESLEPGDWLLNPATKEVHKVVEVDDDGTVVFTGEDGNISVHINELHDLLLKVVGE